MTIKEFLNEMDDGYFPEELGIEQDFYFYDPPFTNSELKKMEKSGIIKVNWQDEYFQLTKKATEIKNKEN